MSEVVLRDGDMVLTAVCPKCRHEFPTQPPPTSPTSTPCPCGVGPSAPSAAPTLGGAAPAAWLPPGQPPGQHAPVAPPAPSPTGAMLSLSISASSAASLNGGHVVVNTMPSVAASHQPSISVTATLPAAMPMPMWPWQSAPAPTPTWAMMPAPAMMPTTNTSTWPTMPLPAWAAPQQAPQQVPQQVPAWAMPPMPPAPLTLGLELFPRLPPQAAHQHASALKGAQYRLTGGGILHERGRAGPHHQDAPVLLQTQHRGKPSAPPHACASLAPEQSPSTPLSFVLPGGGLAVALEAVPRAESSGTPEADLRLLQATTQALKASGWYYEGFSWQESAATLRSAAPGTFLVRDSSDPRFLFSLSVQTDRGPTSVRLLYIAGGFRLDAEPHLAPTMPLFPCVLQLIEHYAESRSKRVSAPVQPPANTTGTDGHQSRAGNRVQVWVDACGQVYSQILLTAPRRHTVPGLQHLARLAVHRQLKVAAASPSASTATPALVDRSERIQKLELPTTLCRYLEEYPFTL